jgi:hypothetical protein
MMIFILTNILENKVSSELLAKGGCLYKCLCVAFTNSIIRDMKYSPFSSPPHGHFKIFNL